MNFDNLESKIHCFDDNEIKMFLLSDNRMTPMVFSLSITVVYSMVTTTLLLISIISMGMGTDDIMRFNHTKILCAIYLIQCTAFTYNNNS